MNPDKPRSTVGTIQSFRGYGVAIYGENGTEIIRVQPTDNWEADKALALKVSRLLFPSPFADL